MYKYKLPNTNGQAIESQINNNSLIIIGANGSGKSKLGAWMEEQDMNSIHRVGAQRSLQFGDYIQLKSFEQAENLLLCGQEEYEVTKLSRWGYSRDRKLTTTLLHDYENVLAALIAKKNNQNDEFIKWCKEQKQLNKTHCEIPYTDIDILKKIWGKVFPHRHIKFDDAKVTAMFSKRNSENVEYVEYKGKDMSDGERVALYLIAQCLCIPKNKTIIIDEPEVHLHRSIMNRLWTEIENERQDCLFIYITHDTQFAASHRQSEKIWVKSFDGQMWELEKIKRDTLPEQLLLDIMGNRKPVIFVEGTADSYDTKLYSEIYKRYFIVPCGSCSMVIAQTKSMKNNQQLHHLKCYGIIDRDYRSNYEIEQYKKDNIYTLEVAEVENLFLVEELLNVVNRIMEFPDNSKVDEVKHYIMEERYANEINRQICEAIVSEIKYKLSIVEISRKNEEKAKQALDGIYDTISYETIKKEREKVFNDIRMRSNYKEILSVFNCKSLSTSTGHFFGLANNGYCDFVIRQLNGGKSEEIINAIRLYLPNEIPS